MSNTTDDSKEDHLLSMQQTAYDSFKEITNEDAGLEEKILDHQHNWIKLPILGVAFGYPPCCIEAFIKEENVRSDDFEDGFLPCKECYENKTKEELYAEINERRLFKGTFPDDALSRSSMFKFI